MLPQCRARLLVRHGSKQTVLSVVYTINIKKKCVCVVGGEIKAVVYSLPSQVGDFCILPNDTAGWECSYNQHLNANAYTPSPPPVNMVSAVCV